MLDFHLYPWFERVEAIKNLTEYNILPAEEYPVLLHWKNIMEQMSCVKETMLPTDWHMEFMMLLAARRPQYDIGLEVGNAEAKLWRAQ